MNFFHHKDLGNHLLQLCPKVVKDPVYAMYWSSIMLYVVAFMVYCEIAFALTVPAIKTKGFIGSGMEHALPLPTDNF